MAYHFCSTMYVYYVVCNYCIAFCVQDKSYFCDGILLFLHTVLNTLLQYAKYTSVLLILFMKYVNRESIDDIRYLILRIYL